jgi:hypothetical protein
MRPRGEVMKPLHGPPIILEWAFVSVASLVACPFGLSFSGRETFQADGKAADPSQIQVGWRLAPAGPGPDIPGAQAIEGAKSPREMVGVTESAMLGDPGHG